VVGAGGFLLRALQLSQPTNNEYAKNNEETGMCAGAVVRACAVVFFFCFGVGRATSVLARLWAFVANFAPASEDGSTDQGFAT